jgi:tRNA dimethylallyltransferase
MRPHKHLNSLKTVGYKELFDYLDGQCTLEEAVDAIKQNTRRFAKRQLTWFKKEEDAVWLDAGGKEMEELVGEVLGKC